MPVIGRLDGQVDEVLIAPLEKRRREGEASAREEDVSREDERDEEKHAPQRQPEPDAARDELPVWLL